MAVWLSILLLSTIVASTYSIVPPTPEIDHTPIPHGNGGILAVGYNTTRRQAIMEYVMALYQPAYGTFYLYLHDWPYDPRFSLYPTMEHVYVPFVILRYLDYIDDFDWTNSTRFLQSLTNDPSKDDEYGPINMSEAVCSDTFVCNMATDMYPELDIGDALDIDAVVEFLSNLQVPSGGFLVDKWAYEIADADLVPTWDALETLDRLGRPSAIDRNRALDFVLSCYHGNGFSYYPFSSVDVYATPPGLMCLGHLNATDRIDRENVISFVLFHFDNQSGCAASGTLVETERLIWSLYLLDALDRIDCDAVVQWVLWCQSPAHGGFLSSPDADIYDERLVYCRSALHILSMLGRMDVLDRKFLMYGYPEHTTPSSYYREVDEWNRQHSSTSPGAGWGGFPNVDIVGTVAGSLPMLLCMVCVGAPFLCICNSDREERARRALLKERRKRRRPKW